jgi:hypothetical protein
MRVKGEARSRWAKPPPAERGTSDRAERRGSSTRAWPGRVNAGVAGARTAASAATDDIDRARIERWAGLPEEDRRSRQSQSDGDRAAAARAAEVAELENDETLQAMWT